MSGKIFPKEAKLRVAPERRAKAENRGVANLSPGSGESLPTEGQAIFDPDNQAQHAITAK